MIQQKSPDSGTTIYHYDGDGNLTSKTDARGIVTNNTYDPLDRILTTTYPSDAAENVAYKYDESGHGFGIGRLTSLTDAAGSLSRSYDERGNMLAETRVGAATTLKTVYTYDAASRVASMTYPSGWTASYTRDIMGRIWQIPLTAPGGVAAGNAITNATYEPYGPLYTLTFGNGVNESRTFDLDYRVTNLADSGAVSLQNLTYAYDANDNISSIADGVTAANSQSFAYDVLNRLKAATGGYGIFGWTYDKLGNRLQQTLGGAVTSYGYMTGTNRLANITAGSTTPVAYTAAGNITSIPTIGATVATISYNAANRLNGVTGTALAITGTTYDAFGQRFSKTSGGSPTVFTYGEDGGLIEESQDGGATDHVYLNARPIATIAASTGKVYFLHDDRLGTPQLATDSDQNIVWSAQYQPFGDTGLSTVGSITQNLRLPGQYFDPETGWSQNGFREYVPALGRYLQTDPIGLANSVNIYGYAHNNPTKRVDRSGLADWCDTELTGSCYLDSDSGCIGDTASCSFPVNSQYERAALTEQQAESISDYFEKVGDYSNYAALGFLATPGLEAGFPVMEAFGFCSKQVAKIFKPEPVHHGIDTAADAFAGMKELDKQWAVIQAVWPAVKWVFSVPNAY